MDVIPLMEDKQLECLGVSLIGQRVLLRNAAKNIKSELKICFPQANCHTLS